MTRGSGPMARCRSENQKLAGALLIALAAGCSRARSQSVGSPPLDAPAAATSGEPLAQRMKNPLADPKSLGQVGVPLEATRAAIPPDNPQTPGKIALGKQLFFDPRLSADGTVACATCHDPAKAFTDGLPTSVGIASGVGQRNAPTIFNALYNATQFWDGRARTLEDQAALPIVNPI